MPDSLHPLEYTSIFGFGQDNPGAASCKNDNFLRLENVDAWKSKNRSKI